MVGKPCVPCAPKSPTLAVPAWADPRLSLLTSSYKVTEVVTTMGDDVLLARADPTRVAIGVLGPGGLSLTLVPRPAAVPSGFGFSVSFGVSVMWFDLFTYGPLVVDAWYGRNSGNQTVQIVEVYRLQ